jgi:hypothetical protein
MKWVLHYAIGNTLCSKLYVRLPNYTGINFMVEQISARTIYTNRNKIIEFNNYICIYIYASMCIKLHFDQFICISFSNQHSVVHALGS